MSSEDASSVQSFDGTDEYGTDDDVDDYHYHVCFALLSPN